MKVFYSKSKLWNKINELNEEIYELKRDLNEKNQALLDLKNRLTSTEKELSAEQLKSRRSAIIEDVNLPKCKSELCRTCKYVVSVMDEKGQYIIGCSRDLGDCYEKEDLSLEIERLNELLELYRKQNELIFLNSGYSIPRYAVPIINYSSSPYYNKAVCENIY